MTFLDPDMVAWVRSTAPYLAAVPACKYGTNWQKSWLFCSNRLDIGETYNHDPDSHLNLVGIRLAAFFQALGLKLARKLAGPFVQGQLQPLLSQKGGND